MKQYIKSSRLITPAGVTRGVVVIDGEKIAEVITGETKLAGSSVIDVGDSVVMPGVVDTHVHLNEPGRTEWEGFETGTQAAAFGGVTTLVDMPLNASPVTTTVAALKLKLAAAIKNAHVNLGFWGGIVPGNHAEIEPFAAAGVLGFKAFLSPSGIDEFENVTEDDLRKAMPLIAKTGLPLLVHCEVVDDIKRTAKGLERSYNNYLASRPPLWEDKAISLVIDLCRQYNCHVHIVHLSSANSLQQIAQAKKEGLPLTVETAQHYLYFNGEDIEDGRTDLKCAPPIRLSDNNAQLWQALKKGTIDFVATDHSPSPPELKSLQSGDFTTAWGGIASLQFALPVLWTAGRRHNISLEDICAWLCERPTHLAGLQQTKGKLQAGYDADIVIWNPEETFTVTADIIQHKHSVTPYLNERLFGVVQKTYVQGQCVYNNGSIKTRNAGKLLLTND